MKKCPNGHEMPDEALFCEECGYKFPQTKECSQCHAELKITAKFCMECGYSFIAKNNAGNGEGVSVGEKSVVAGDVVSGNQDNRKIFGNYTTTTIHNEDLTKQVVNCHVCNKPLPILGTATCFECKKYTCDAHLDKETGLCQACVQRHEEQYRSHLTALLEKDGFVSVAARQELERLQRELKIKDERKNAIESEVNEWHLSKVIPRNQGEMSMLDRMAYDKAVKAFYEDGNLEEAVEWFGKATDQENAVAKSKLAEVSLRLGECYEKGKGVEKDLEEAVKWYGKAVEQGNAEAKIRLAEAQKRKKSIFGWF